MRPSDSPYIIPVFIPHQGCPHQCIFCNQSGITGSERKMPENESIAREIDRFLSFQKSPDRSVQIAFYGGNFLGLEKTVLTSLLELAGSYVKKGRVESIRFSTRPDTVNDAILNFLKNYPVSVVELGAQSMDDNVLDLSKRGHTSQDTRIAVTLLKQYGYTVGLQMMVGLPGDDEEKNFETGKQIALLEPDFVRIYPTVVIERSPLAAFYRKGSYKPLSIENAVQMVEKLYLLFTVKNISVIRMGLQADQDLDDGVTVLDGPYHPAFGQLVISRIFLHMVRFLLEKTPECAKNMSDGLLELSIPPRHESDMRGQKNGNLSFLKTHYGLKDIRIFPDKSLPSHTLKIGDFTMNLTDHAGDILEFLKNLSHK